MNRTTKYILKKFMETFNPIFFSLFFIVSIVYFIKISQITAIVKVTFFEIGELYIFFLPRIILYTFPVVFFIAIAISLLKMSKDNEINVIFSFGYSPKTLMKIFLNLSIAATFFLLLNSIFLIPLSIQLYKNFIDIKKAEASLNIKAMEFGQKISNWVVFINKSNKKNSFSNVILYSKQNNKENFILAKTAHIDNKNNNLKLILQNGKAFVIKKGNIKQIDYKQMIIFNKIHSSIFAQQGIWHYWKQIPKDKGRAKDFANYIIISVFPLLGFLLAISLGIYNPRYENKNIYLNLFITVLAYYVSMYFFISINPWIALILTPITTFIFSLIIFKIKILKRY